MAEESLEMPNEFSKGELALIEKTAYMVVKADRKEHAEEREQAMEILAAKVMTEVRAKINDHSDNCPAMHAAGRLRTWGPAFLGTTFGVLFGAGVINLPSLVKWIFLRINGA